VGWANRITVVRALLTVAVWALVACAASGDARCWAPAFTLFVLTAATDVLDGAVARRWGDVTVFGRIADPLVDKLLVVGTLVLLLEADVAREVLPAWVVVLVVVRELIVTALRGAVEAGGASFAAASWGKAKMLAQCVALGAVLLHGAGVSWLAQRHAVLGERSLTWALVLLAAVLTAASAADYVRRAAGLLGGR
jgi:CDP-diacylglycerol---glycerol-3-phosphate 3-phosphatidyltransferase